ncbi:putative membrane protein YdjX (TVP38/TMEM64 family) [Sphingorhabdus rigui]|uniref:TVP38/TMEM64 family membrane protein n=1 Tax=Sphingorhabdus rigui TaxID=1282858 RepID=A0A840B1J2_9SPHN|nr:TVP38/TMEM64 family protein [Sphingorhabdus rigui]MBB3943791.1 putative membrane protein YdjX (TVP38/TMEM64 family) [Sphingorhabdus rigui]
MKKAVLALVLIGAIAAYFIFDLGQYLSLDNFKASQADIVAAKDAYPALYIAGFFLLYVAVTGLSIPGAAIMSLVAGALFGVVIGTLIVSFASTMGATLAFLSSRYVLRDWVQGKFGERLRAVDDGLEKDGAFYLFTLRLIPVFPFFVINLLMGLTRIKTGTFFWVSQIGMLPATIVFVNAGTQISRIESTAGLLSPTLIASFVALAFFPWAAKGIVAIVKRSRG